MPATDSTSGLEKTAQEIAALIFEDARGHFDRVVEMLGIGEVEMGVNRTCLGIRCPEHQFLDTRLDHRPYAHDAGFDGDDQNGARQPVVVHGVGAVSQGENLGVRRRIVCTDRVIMTPADDLLVDQQHGTYRYLALILRLTRFF